MEFNIRKYSENGHKMFKKNQRTKQKNKQQTLNNREIPILRHHIRRPLSTEKNK